MKSQRKNTRARSLFSRECALSTVTAAIAAALTLVLAGTAQAQASDCGCGGNNNPEPLNVLLVTGGGWHDFETQKEILTEGIGERLNVNFTIDHEGGNDPTSELSLHEDHSWAEEYDLVMYNISYSVDQSPETAQHIIDGHVEHGVPAVLLHGSVHSYRRTGNENWFEFLGARSMRHESSRPVTHEVLDANHPVMAGFPDPWAPGQGELYVIEEFFPTATALAHAYGEDTEEHHTTIWVNEYKGVRLFVTTIGHHNETMEDDTYLDLVSRGILWATGKLDNSID